MRDLNERFIFDGTDVRGEIVRVDHAFKEIAGIHDYPLPVQRLLGQMLAAVVAC